jgi:cytochrome c5
MFSVRNRYLAALCLWGIPIAASAKAPALPDGPGKAEVQKVCSGCHAAEIVMSKHETKEGWEQIVNDMVQKGANGTDDEFNQIIDYLAAHFSKQKTSTNVDRTPGAGL